MFKLLDSQDVPDAIQGSVIQAFGSNQKELYSLFLMLENNHNKIFQF